jgi:hypothetical protein
LKFVLNRTGVIEKQDTPFMICRQTKGLLGIADWLASFLAAATTSLGRLAPRGRFREFASIRGSLESRMLGAAKDGFFENIQ